MWRTSESVGGGIVAPTHADELPGDPVDHSPRQTIHEVHVESVERCPEQASGDHVSPASHAEDRACGNAPDLGRNLHRRLPGPDHEHPRAGERVGRAIGARVADAGRGGSVKLWPDRIPVMAAGNDDCPVALGRSAGDRDAPGALGCRLDTLDARRETDASRQVECLRERRKVLGHRRVMGKISHRRRHGEAAVLHVGARHVRAQGAIRPRQPAVVLVPPVSSHVRALLEADGVELMLAQRLQRGQPRTAGADDADAIVRHALPSSPQS